MGLANRVVPTGTARAAAETLAAEIAAFPQTCMRSDRRSVYAGLGQDEIAALPAEFSGGLAALRSEGVEGAARFASGAGRHGTPDPPRREHP
jgi:enoyl-CoA hydratase